MLLYIALVQLIAEDFSRQDVAPASASLDSTGSLPKKAMNAKKINGRAHDSNSEPATDSSTSGFSEQGSLSQKALDVEKNSRQGGGGYQPAAQLGWVLASCHAALWLGAAIMSVIAIWA